MRLRIAILVALAAAPFAASAHLAGGVDITVGGRVLDFGYDPATPIAGQPLTLAFNAGDAATGAILAADAVWVRIASGGTMAFAGTLSPAGGNVTYSTLAPPAGEYEITARYAFGDEEVEATFPFRVAEAPASPVPTGPAFDVAPFLTLLFGLALGLMVRRRIRH